MTHSDTLKTKMRLVRFASFWNPPSHSPSLIKSKNLYHILPSLSPLSNKKIFSQKTLSEHQLLVASQYLYSLTQTPQTRVEKVDVRIDERAFRLNLQDAKEGDVLKTLRLIARDSISSPLPSSPSQDTTQETSLTMHLLKSHTSHPALPSCSLDKHHLVIQNNGFSVYVGPSPLLPPSSSLSSETKEARVLEYTPLSSSHSPIKYKNDVLLSFKHPVPQHIPLSLILSLTLQSMNLKDSSLLNLLNDENVLDSEKMTSIQELNIQALGSSLQNIKDITILEIKNGATSLSEGLSWSYVLRNGTLESTLSVPLESKIKASRLRDSLTKVIQDLVAIYPSRYFLFNMIYKRTEIYGKGWDAKCKKLAKEANLIQKMEEWSRGIRKEVVLRRYE